MDLKHEPFFHLPIALDAVSMTTIGAVVEFDESIYFYTSHVLML